MRSSSLLCLAAALLPSALAFPTYMQAEKRQNLTSIVNGAASTLDGLLGGVAAIVDESNKRPDAAHPFIAPGPTDQRGPCPGLNLLANHGYLPRNGIATVGQTIEAASEGFNMEPDLSGLLAIVAIAFSGNTETETYSIGGEDDRTYSASGPGSKAAGPQYGLDDHSKCEGDVSGTRADYYLANGDDHSGQPDRFRRFVELAKANGGSFGYETANQFYAQNANLSVANNPKLYFQGYTIVVVLGEYPFYAAFMSNGTYNAGGTANYESLSSILGFQYNADNDTFEYVPERYPDNWYRRAIPYGVATPDGLLTNIPATLAAGSINLPNPLGAVLHNPAQLPEIGCAIYQGLTSGVPTAALGTEEKISAISTYLTQKVSSGALNLFGCDIGNFNFTNTGNATGASLQESGPGGGQVYYKPA